MAVSDFILHPYPADVFHTNGGGLVGAVIRLGTQSSIAHNGIFIAPIGPCGVDGCSGVIWETHEAFGSKNPVTGVSGVRERTRCTGCDEYLEVQTLMRDDAERAAAIERSWELLNASTGYDWVQVVRTGVQRLIELFRAVRLGFMVAPLVWLRGALMRFSKETHYFCTEHVAECVLAGRPELARRMPYPVNELFPIALAVFCRSVGREDFELKYSGVPDWVR